MNFLSANELETLGIGATILGSGGGGDPAILYGPLHFLLVKSGPVKIVKPENLSRKSLIVPLALVGAPLISLERIPNSIMFANLIDRISAYYPDYEIVLMPAEIGGCNALSPFMAAAQRKLAVLDGDLIGRAFPQLNMCKPAILSQKKQISFIANLQGEVTVIETDNMESLEVSAREHAIKFGCGIAFATFLFTPEEQEHYLIPGSLTRAMDLGTLLQKHAQDLSLFAIKTQAKKIGTGIITDVCHRVEGGFLMGYAKIKTTTQLLQVFYQNEYLLVQDRTTAHDMILAETPDIIALIETRSGLPLTSESLRYGLKIDLFLFAAPAFWQEPQARLHVDLKAFGLIDKERSLCIN